MITYLVVSAFLLICLFLFIRIQIGFVLVVCAYIIFPPKVKVNVGPLDFYLYNSLVLVTWCAFIFNLITKNIPKLRINILFFKIIAVFTIGMTLLIPFAAELNLSTHLKSFVFNTFFYFSLVLIAWHIFYKNSHFVMMGKFLLIFSIITSVYGIYCYISQTNPYMTAIDIIYEGYRMSVSNIAEERGGLMGRVQSTMNHPITWGGVCAILFYYFLSGASRVEGLSRMVVLILLALNVIISGSRSCILFLIVGVYIFILYSKLSLKIKIAQYLIVILVVGIVCVYQIPSLNKYVGILETTLFFWDSDLASQNNVGGSSVSMRISQMEGTLEMISGSKMMAGLGQGYIGYYFNTFGGHPILHGFESIIFMALVNSGFIGLFLWVWLFYRLFRLAQRAEVKFKIRKAYDPVLIKAYVISYFVFCMFTGFMNTQLLFFAIYVLMIKFVITENTIQRQLS